MKLHKLFNKEIPNKTVALGEQLYRVMLCIYEQILLLVNDATSSLYETLFAFYSIYQYSYSKLSTEFEDNMSIKQRELCIQNTGNV